MKLKTLLLALAAIVAVGIVSCTKTQKSECEDACGACTTITVDSLMANAENMVGDTVTVEGVCSHLCSHGGRKAFIMGADSTLLRCEATAEMGGAFSPECVGKTLKVTGVVCEQRIDEEAVKAMEERYAAASKAEQSHEACDTEKKAAGQAGIDTFEARMADYRAKIAERAEKEGKAYLSYFYIDATSYEIEQPAAEAEEAE